MVWINFNFSWSSTLYSTGRSKHFCILSLRSRTYEYSDDESACSCYRLYPPYRKTIGGEKGERGIKEITGQGTVTHDVGYGKACSLDCVLKRYDWITYMPVTECRRNGVAIHNRFGSGRDPIWLDTVTCTGNERSLTECGHIPWGQHDCRHSEDVAISCNKSLSEFRKSLLS